MSQIIFINEPTLSEQEADKAFNERRLSLLPHIKNFLSNHEHFRTETMHVSFATRGISSLISIIETPTNRVVLKIPLSKDYSPGESQFLDAWETVGVSVPHILESGVIDGHEYALMEFIHAPILSEKYSTKELVEKKLYYKMGQTLAKMHTAVAEGYGRVVGGRAEFLTFTEWIDSEDMQRRVEYVIEQSLLDEQHGTFEEIRNILIQHSKKNPKSSYCHDDFGTANIFATEPITIFDPNPRFNNGYIDFGRSLMNHISNDHLPESRTQLLSGYFEERPYDKKALHAAITLTAYMKFPYWHKIISKRGEMIERTKNYLKENRDLLN